MLEIDQKCNDYIRPLFLLGINPVWEKVTHKATLKHCFTTDQTDFYQYYIAEQKCF